MSNANAIDSHQAKRSSNGCFGICCSRKGQGRDTKNDGNDVRSNGNEVNSNNNDNSNAGNIKKGASNNNNSNESKTPSPLKSNNNHQGGGGVSPLSSTNNSSPSNGKQLTQSKSSSGSDKGKPSTPVSAAGDGDVGKLVSYDVTKKNQSTSSSSKRAGEQRVSEPDRKTPNVTSPSTTNAAEGRSSDANEQDENYLTFGVLLWNVKYGDDVDTHKNLLKKVLSPDDAQLLLLQETCVALENSKDDASSDKHEEDDENTEKQNDNEETKPTATEGGEEAKAEEKENNNLSKFDFYGKSEGAVVGFPSKSTIFTIPFNLSLSDQAELEIPVKQKEEDSLLEQMLKHLTAKDAKSSITEVFNSFGITATIIQVNTELGVCVSVSLSKYEISEKGKIQLVLALLKVIASNFPDCSIIIGGSFGIDLELFDVKKTEENLGMVSIVPKYKNLPLYVVPEGYTLAKGAEGQKQIGNGIFIKGKVSIQLDPIILLDEEIFEMTESERKELRETVYDPKTRNTPIVYLIAYHIDQGKKESGNSE